MKKFFQSKGFIVSSLALLCVSILGVCWFVSRDRTGDFRPDESPPSSVTGDWSDGGTQTDGDNGADAYAPGQSTDAEEEYTLFACRRLIRRCRSSTTSIIPNGKSPGYESISSHSLLFPIGGAAYHPAFCAAIPSSMICAAARTILLVLLLPGVR